MSSGLVANYEDMKTLLTGEAVGIMTTTVNKKPGELDWNLLY